MEENHYKKISFILSFIKMSKKENLKKYLESCIDFTWYNTDGAIYLDTFNNVYITFTQEQSWVKPTIDNIKQWLLWLPSCLNIAFSYYDISKVLKECWYKETVDQSYQDKYYRENIAKIIYSYK